MTFQQRSGKQLWLKNTEKSNGERPDESANIWYVSRKAPEEVRRKWIKKLCTLLTISGADNQRILEAIDKTDFRDFEDAMQDCCAAEAGADYIVTVNKRDFAGHSKINPMTPDEFLSIIV